jgi:aspartate racemase
MKTIGILGGMGPKATVFFDQRLVSICQEKYCAKEDCEFPPSIIYNVPLKGITEKGIVDTTVLSNLKKGINILGKDKVDFIVIDCNTVHYYIDQLRKTANVPIISIIEEVLKQVKKKKYKTIGIVGSQTTLNKGIYDKVFSAAKLNLIHPTAKQEATITAIIFNVMCGKNNRADVSKLKRIAQSMNKKGADAVIIGCTELSVVAFEEDFSIPCLDSSEILAEAAIKYSRT